MGYSIEYPENWAQEKEEGEGSESNVTRMLFPPKNEPFSVTDNYPTSVIVQDFSYQVTITPELFTLFTESGEKSLKEEGQIIQNKKEYSYIFPDGTKSIGQSLEAEFSNDGTNIKTWIIIIPSNQKIYSFVYTSFLDRYILYYDTVLAMIASWKISN